MFQAQVEPGLQPAVLRHPQLQVNNDDNNNNMNQSFTLCEVAFEILSFLLFTKLPDFALYAKQPEANNSLDLHKKHFAEFNLIQQNEAVATIIQ